MTAPEGMRSLRVWDEPLTPRKLQHMLVSLGSQTTEPQETHRLVKALESSEQPSLDRVQDYTHAELVNVDLTPEMLGQIV